MPKLGSILTVNTLHEIRFLSPITNLFPYHLRTEKFILKYNDSNNAYALVKRGGVFSTLFFPKALKSYFVCKQYIELRYQAENSTQY